jgi:hypothetical protein
VGAVWDADAVQRMCVNLTWLFPRVRAANKCLCCACVVVLSVFLIADLFVPHLDQGCGAGDVEAGASSAKLWWHSEHCAHTMYSVIHEDIGRHNSGTTKRRKRQTQQAYWPVVR